MALDHYTVQFLIGHWDFNAKLASFGLSGTVMCRCGKGWKTVEHVLFNCRINMEDRNRLKGAFLAEGGSGLAGLLG